MKPQIEPAWLALARGELGVREAPGSSNNPRVLAYYADAGHPEIKHDSVAWCAAAACAMLERSGHASPKTLSARDFARWGKPLNGPRVGAVAVLTRGDPTSWQGHVGFVTDWNETHVRLVSGNVGDAVTEGWFPLAGERSSLIGYRWPVTPDNSRTIRAVQLSLLDPST